VKLAEREAELERLRAEVAELRAAAVPDYGRGGEARDEADADGGFAFGQDDDKPLHHNTGGEFTACGLVADAIPLGHGLISVREHVTCANCVAEIRRPRD
jgi:hypothetical protein